MVIIQTDDVLTVDVRITQSVDVSMGDEYVCMISFDGTASGPYFQGRILPGGVDTQTKRSGQAHTLSARYLMEGKDCDGRPCRIYVENNAVDPQNPTEPMTTAPHIFTNSEVLKWLETAALYGRIEQTEQGVRIHIRKKES